MTDSGSYTPETIARRIKMAEALLADPKKPITHWAEGLNELAKGALGGYQMNQAERMEREGQSELARSLSDRLGIPAGDAPAAPKTGFQKIASLLGFGGNEGGGAASSISMDAPVAPIPTPAPAAPAQPAPSTGGRVYSNDEVSPLDPIPERMAQPRGIRNNNPLNIEAGKFTQGQPGFFGSDGRFARFETPEQGTQAANKLLDVYQNKHGLNTVNGIVGRWAPAADGNNVSAYAANVAKRLGIGPDDPIPPELRPQLIAAMGQHENGRPISNVAAALNAPPGQAPYKVAGAPVASPSPAEDPAALPPNSQPAGPQPLPAAQPAPVQPAIPAAPDAAKQQIAAMLNSKNPYVRQQGMAIAKKVLDEQLMSQFKQDFDIHHRPDGTVVATNKKNPSDMRVIAQPGAAQSTVDFEANKAGAVKKAEKQAERDIAAPDKRKQEELSGGIVVQDIDRAIAEMDKATLPTTGAVGAGLSNIGGTAARNVKALVDTVKANAGFAELAKMRAASPTGGALGAISDKETAMLQATIGNLEQSQGVAQFRDNLKRVKNVYMDIIHGPGNGPREKLSFDEKKGGSTTKTGVKWSVE